ncbi:MAG: hypothetical protein HRT99_00035, partial [Mycoplasmatales bacterium]|nr:hypothetical protein [Mycoplasmatales bacterium]
ELHKFIIKNSGLIILVKEYNDSEDKLSKIADKLLEWIDEDMYDIGKGIFEYNKQFC